MSFGWTVWRGRPRPRMTTTDDAGDGYPTVCSEPFAIFETWETSESPLVIPSRMEPHGEGVPRACPERPRGAGDEGESNGNLHFPPDALPFAIFETCSRRSPADRRSG